MSGKNLPVMAMAPVDGIDPDGGREAFLNWM